MKKYKVGNTIYVKGTIVDSDCAQQYLIKPGDYTYGFWFKRDAIADLPEQVKPVLPKAVADEMEKAKETNKFFDLYIQRVIGNNPKFYPHSSKYWYHHDGNNTETLLNAWNNGYTVAKEKRYLVGLDGLVTTDGAKQYLTNKNGKWFASRIQPSLHQAFTGEELNNAPEWVKQLNREEVTDDEQ